MQSRVISFSIKPRDKEADSTIEFFKVYCGRRGIKFSFIVLKALNHYKTTVLEKLDGEE